MQLSRDHRDAFSLGQKVRFWLFKKMSPLQDSVSNECGFQPRQRTNKIHMQYTHAKISAAIQELEEREKHCRHVGYHTVGEIQPAHKKNSPQAATEVAV